ncbi:MAG TPA: AraC family transcriptional regulator, partial [Stenotrophomonas sp.]|nr:AraC family transcriptional regulator [Stenotrophomonas sp.]
FDNCCSFARAFRARYGQSASRYREAIATLPPESAKSSVVSRKKFAATQS